LTDDQSLIEYVMDLEHLVRWFAKPFGDNEPIWPLEITITDIEGKSHTEPLEDNRRLAATWRRCMGPVTETQSTGEEET
jgi:predicted hydrolase (HD superfamily)